MAQDEARKQDGMTRAHGAPEPQGADDFPIRECGESSHATQGCKVQSASLSDRVKISSSEPGGFHGRDSVTLNTQSHGPQQPGHSAMVDDLKATRCKKKVFLI